MWLLYLWPLLLIALSTNADTVQWKECDKTMICLVENRGKYFPYGEGLGLESAAKSIFFKPECKDSWEIIIRHQARNSGESLKFKLNDKPKISCQNGGVFLEGDNTDKAEIRNAKSDETTCSFTLAMKDKKDTVSAWLTGFGNRFATEIENKKESIIKTDIFSFELVQIIVPCHKLEPFECDKDEICQEVQEVPNDRQGVCPENYHLMFRPPTGSKYEEASSMICESGEYVFVNKKNVESKTTKACAKCARKRCSLCDFDKEKNKGSLDSHYHEHLIVNKSSSHDECTTIKCEEGFLVIGDGAYTSQEEATCSPDTKDEEHPRWVVDENSIEIKSAACMEKVPCDKITKIDNAPCDRNSPEAKKCRKFGLNLTTHTPMCKEDHQMMLTVNKTDISIDPPVCDPTGTWMILMEDKLAKKEKNGIVYKNVTPAMLGVKELRIKCMEIAELKIAEAETSFVLWLVIIIITICLIAGGVILFVWLKRRKPARPPSSSLAKTSTATRTSSKGASSDLEPLTSQMKSSTADSTEDNKKKEKKPIVLADVSGVTATAAQTAKEKKKEESKKDQRRDISEKRASSKADDRKMQSAKSVEYKEKTAITGEDTPTSGASKKGGEPESNLENKGEDIVKIDSLLRQDSKTTPSTLNQSTKKVKLNTEFVRVTSTEDEDEQSKTGSIKRKPKKRRM